MWSICRSDQSNTVLGERTLRLNISRRFTLRTQTMTFITGRDWDMIYKDTHIAQIYVNELMICFSLPGAANTNDHSDNAFFKSVQNLSFDRIT